MAQKSGAVKSTKLEIEVPSIDGATIEKINVTPKSTLGTDGKNSDEIKMQGNEELKKIWWINQII